MSAEQAVTLGQALADATSRLQQTSPTPRLDAEVLLLEAAGCTRSDLIAHPDRSLAAECAARYADWIDRRTRGEPVALIVGYREFWSLRMQVSPAVLVPRPETETLVERALECIPPYTPVRIADLGTGSGAVAIALAMERPCATVIAGDISQSALAVAAENAKTHNAVGVRFSHGGWFDALADEQRFDIIVANPPYIAESDPCLGQPPLSYEPLGALASGPDGMDAIDRLVAGAPRFLRPGGWLLMEHGAGQGEAVGARLRAAGFREVVTYRDMAGLPRVSAGRVAADDGD